MLTFEALLWFAACLVTPAVWGWFVYWLFTSLGLQHRLPSPKSVGSVSTLPAATWDYQI
jgi:hypothetical protein